MSAALVGLGERLGELGTGAKVAVATAAALVSVTIAGGAVALVGSAGGGSTRAELASGLAQAGEVRTPIADAGPAALAPLEGAVLPPIPAVGSVAAGAGPAPAASVDTSQRAAPARAAAAPITAAPTTAAPAPAAPAAAAVARRTPSAAEVKQAIDAMPNYIKTIIPPTPALVAEVGDQVCTAFDEGHTYAEVKATGLQMLTALPRTTVLPGGADWAVRTLVALYCPGHASKLV